MGAHDTTVISFAALGPPSDVEAVERWIILVTYLAVWILLLFPSLFPLGRPGTASLGGVVIVLTKYCFHGGLDGLLGSIDFNTIALLAGLMGVAFYLEDFGLFHIVTRWLLAGEGGGNKQRLLRTAVIASVGSMFLTNDTVCLFLSPIICNIFLTKRRLAERGSDGREGQSDAAAGARLSSVEASHSTSNPSPPSAIDVFPYLLAISTFSNIGSAMSSIGNPQNVLVTSYAGSELTFLKFFLAMALPTLIALALNYLMLLYFIRPPKLKVEARGSEGEAYSVFRDEEVGPISEVEEGGDEHHVEMTSPELRESKESPAIVQNADTLQRGRRRESSSPVASEEAYVPSSTTKRGTEEVSSRHSATHVENPHLLPSLEPTGVSRSRSMTWVIAFTFIVLVVALIAGVPGGLAAVLSACILMVASALRQMWYKREGKRRGKPFVMVDETNRMLRSIDYSILLLFIGQFILVGAFRDTGVAERLFDASVGQCGEEILHMPCLMGFVAFITIFSNLISNVPLIILFRPMIDALPNPNLAWLVTAWFSTIAGNLIMMGSAANLIVANEAERLGVQSFTTKAHGAFGIPSTIVIMAVGLIYFGYIFPHIQPALGL